MYSNIHRLIQFRLVLNTSSDSSSVCVQNLRLHGAGPWPVVIYEMIVAAFLRFHSANQCINFQLDEA